MHKSIFPIALFASLIAPLQLRADLSPMEFSNLATAGQAAHQTERAIWNTWPGYVECKTKLAKHGFDLRRPSSKEFLSNCIEGLHEYTGLWSIPMMGVVASYWDDKNNDSEFDEIVILMLQRARANNLKLGKSAEGKNDSVSLPVMLKMNQIYNALFTMEARRGVLQEDVKPWRMLYNSSLELIKLGSCGGEFGSFLKYIGDDGRLTSPGDHRYKDRMFMASPEWADMCIFSLGVNAYARLQVDPDKKAACQSAVDYLAVVRPNKNSRGVSSQLAQLKAFMSGNNKGSVADRCSNI
ncbi:hypothetical protein [Synechococcus sp. MIT S9451]|uniref:hypothetical protein n=1 Tax=Synechococcus sp. MIT S9451 TaxID=3082543 RepID=UPI0039B5E5D8